MKTTTLLNVLVLLGLIPTLSCAQELPQSVAQAEKLESDDALPATPLYMTKLAPGKPGDLLSHEAFSGYALPSVARAVRIAYHSLDADGHDVVTTAVVLIPEGTKPADGWPIIAWAHGTSGVNRSCAPSLMKDLWYGDEGLPEMLQGGFAVVATDYHGLGAGQAHPWVNKLAQARDVLYSIPAARAAVPELGRRWAVDGHSQGGVAAWGVAELESGLQDESYVGAVSVAGAARLDRFMNFINETRGFTIYLAYAAAGIHARFPSFKPDEILTPGAMTHYAEATSQGCWYRGYALLKDTPPGTYLKAGWQDNQYVRRWVTESEEGAIRITKPILVIAGEADTTVPIDGVREIVTRACRSGSTLSFKSYPGLEHDPAMVKSMAEQLSWIKDRFEGKAAPYSCPRSSQ
jgi:alpha-beta hydrolase superfamily lysophospholipase